MSEERELSRVFRLGTFANSLEAVALGANWTGLPILLVKVTGDEALLVWLFIAQSVASIVGLSVAGVLTDRIGVARLVVVGNVVTIFGLVMLAGTAESGNIAMLMLISLLIQVSTTIVGNGITTWLSLLVPRGQLREWMAGRGAALSTAKLVSTAAGPILFALLGVKVLLVLALLVLLALAVLLVAFRNAGFLGQGDTSQRDVSFLRGIADGIAVVGANRSIARLLLLQSLAGLLGIPVTAVVLRMLGGLPDATPALFTAFWVVGFAMAIVTNALVGRGMIRGRDPVVVTRACLLFTSLAVVAMAGTRTALALIAIFGMTVAARTILNVVLFAAVVPMAAQHLRGRIVAINQLASDTASFVALVAFGLLDLSNLPSASAVLALSVGFIALIATRQRPQDEESTYKEIAA